MRYVRHDRCKRKLNIGLLEVSRPRIAAKLLCDRTFRSHCVAFPAAARSSFTTSFLLSSANVAFVHLVASSLERAGCLFVVRFAR